MISKPAFSWHNYCNSTGNYGRAVRRIIACIEVDDDSDLIVWLPETPHWRIGLRLADGVKLTAIILPKAVGITGSWNVSWARLETPLSLDNAAAYLGRLESYINGAKAAEFAGRTIQFS
jgi:hypothetical protein